MASSSYGKVNMVYQGAGKIEETGLHDLPIKWLHAYMIS